MDFNSKFLSETFLFVVSGNCFTFVRKNGGKVEGEREREREREGGREERLRAGLSGENIEYCVVGERKKNIQTEHF